MAKFLLLFFNTCSLMGLLTLLSAPVSAQNTDHLFEHKVVNIGVSFSIPPWVIQESGSGIELDILREALAFSGYQIKVNYLSFALSYSMFEAKKLDGILNVKESSLNTGYVSEPVVTFQNVAISLKEKNYPEQIELSFLKDKSVVAFQNASLLLGDAFNQTVKANPHYEEVAQQSLQIKLLMIRGIDFIIMEKNIFGYYWHEALKDPNLIQATSSFKRPVTLHYLFAPNNYRFAFASEEVRDAFNAGLAKLKSNGGYQAIFDRYNHLRDLHLNHLNQ